MAACVVRRGPSILSGTPPRRGTAVCLGGGGGGTAAIGAGGCSEETHTGFGPGGPASLRACLQEVTKETEMCGVISRVRNTFLGGGGVCECWGSPGVFYGPGKSGSVWGRAAGRGGRSGTMLVLSLGQTWGVGGRSPSARWLGRGGIWQPPVRQRLQHVLNIYPLGICGVFF